MGQHVQGKHVLGQHVLSQRVMDQPDIPTAAVNRSAPVHRRAPSEPLRIAVLISGRGSNCRAILEACRAGTLHGSVVGIITDRQAAAGLGLAAEFQVPSFVVERRAKERSNEQFYQELTDAVLQTRPHVVVLAGFMRVVSPQFIQACGPAMINIHPSLLPAFRGLEAQRQALEAGVKIAGCTVHVVVPELDSGPILAQAAVRVLSDDSVETLSNRILEEEHRLLPAVLQALAENQLRILRDQSGEVRVIDSRK